MASTSSSCSATTSPMRSGCKKALDENMLCPFHYYGVAEYLGSDEDPDQGHAPPRCFTGARREGVETAQIRDRAARHRAARALYHRQAAGIRAIRDPRHRAGVLPAGRRRRTSCPACSTSIGTSKRNAPIAPQGSGDQQRRQRQAVIAENATNTSGGSPTANSTTCSPSTCSTRASISPPSTRS